MGKKKEEEKKAGGAPAWMVTFSDMTTLLLVFFVLMLSFATVEKEKFKKAMDSIQETLKTKKDLMSAAPHMVKQTVPISIFKEQPTSKFNPIKNSYTRLVGRKKKKDSDKAASESELKKIAKSVGLDKLEGQSELIIQENQIRVRAPGKIFFEEGSKKMKWESLGFLNKIADVMKKTKFNLEIEGHTDSTPLKDSKYDSNWELSAARSINVLQFFMLKGIDKRRIKAIGYGDAFPLVRENNAQAKFKNRRVEFVFTLPQGL